MENYLVVLILSVFVLLGALYVTIVEQKIIKTKDELLQHGHEITLESTRKELTQVKVEFELTNKALIQVKVELESTRKELKQVQVEFESTKKELKQAQVELESTKTEVKEAQVELKSTRNELQQVKVELESTKREVKQVKVELELESTKKEVKQVQIELESTKKAVKLVKVELDKIITGPTSIPAFTATLSKDFTPPINQIIKFDSVKTNVGDHYSSSTGIFTPPRDGLYMISATIRSNGGQILHCELWVNDAMKEKLFGSNYSSGTANAVLKLRGGDRVFIQKDFRSGGQMLGRDWSMFSGYFIA
ncbi:Hypothetical predicted protein [Mytilus galloprovincialis]|uniref:C1q domain-containing protein n=1 Tax=Mytilus galloprovincialis TaxID=29158 RepID=A0A8B6D237_MYTGA|nr:Hypothetical predicted protein [Mytilus galloprovincialis]